MAFKSDNHDDLSLFRNRLWKLMSDKGINTAKALAIQLLENNLVETEIRYKKDKVLSEKDIQGRKIDTTKKKIEKHLNSDSALDLQGEFAIAYCTFFKCSADYLFGFIPLETHGKTDCSKLTGLRDDAIDMLIKNNNSYFPFIVSTINFLLENDKYIDDKVELLRLISHYVLLSKNIKSYNECGVSQMENKTISLCDEYGTATGIVPVDKMSNIFLLSINEILTRLRDNISQSQSLKRPSIFDILDDMLFDLLRMEDIRQSIHGFNFDIDELSRIQRRFKENKKRLIYLYGCDNINDIDFKKFRSEHPSYSDEDIKLLQEELDF